MDYRTFKPQPDLSSLVKCYWTLEIDAQTYSDKQRIIPDGCIEMAFILGDDIRRYRTEDDFILQPRAMVLGQITEPFYIQPTGCVNSFATRFYPNGFANFVTEPIKNLANKETPLHKLFGEKNARELEKQIITAGDTGQRIQIIESFLIQQLSTETTIDSIVQTTIDSLFASNGSSSIKNILKDDLVKRRQLERKFLNQIGISPKQLSKVIRLQTALKMLLRQTPGSLTHIAYESEYYDQAHFIKDFREFTGISPKEFWENEQMMLSALFYITD